MNRQKHRTLGNKGQDADEDSDDLDLFLPAVKTVGELLEKIKQLQRIHITEAK